MKAFFKNFLKGIPLALGIVFTLMSLEMALDARDGDAWFGAIIVGLIGIPLLFAAIVSIVKE